jgi:hypothetical protein
MATMSTLPKVAHARATQKMAMMVAPTVRPTGDGGVSAISSAAPHPTRLARPVAQQSVEKLPRRGRDPLPRKQRADALLDISQRQSPQRQRVFNRRATNHQIPNHGRPMFWLATCRSWGHAHMQSCKTKSSLS